MIDKLQQKMSAISEECQRLTEDRENLISQIRDIETRITQLVGALMEFQCLCGELETESKDPVESSPLPPQSPTI